jgi:acyl-CoA synthetase (AMP-forming)/AMP-acid ligase II
MTATAIGADIGSRFLETARRLGPQPALIDRWGTTTFSELGRDVELLANGFIRAGLERNQRVAVMIPPSRDFFATTFALFRAGATPVLIDPGLGFANMGRCLAEAAPDAFVGSPKAHLARFLGRWAPTAELKISTSSFCGLPTLGEMRELGGRYALKLPAVSVDTRAAILFTSGGTGAPKGVVYEHSMFAAQVETLRAMFDIKEGERSLATFPLFGLFDAALGMTVVIPDMDFSRPGSVYPLAVIEPMQEHGIQQLFGSPALLDVVGRFGERHGIALPSLTRVMSAGAPVSARILARFAKLLEPGVLIYTPYGATEALPVAMTDSREILGETAAMTAKGAGICVGKPVSGVEVEIIRIEDCPIKTWSNDLRLPRGKIGEIAVKGPMVTGEYFRRVEDMAKAKIGDGKAFWHRMGDLGYFDEQGRLWFCGRKAHRVNELYTICVEGIFNVHPAVKRTAIVGVGNTPVLCVEKEKDTATADEILKTELLNLGQRHELTKNIKDILFHPNFPVDVRHNAKIFRDKLAVWAAGHMR